MTTMAPGQAALERQKTLWRPSHSPEAVAWLERYRAETAGKPLDADRFVPTQSGLSHRDIHTVINDRSLAERFFEVHCDLLEPEKSMYIDPIFGDLHGQKAIRAWLVPIMSGQGSGASFDPVFPAVFMDDGEGGTSIDEWQLVQPVDGKWVPVVKGVSVRRYRDGWIRDAVDFFDTGPIRAGLAAEAAKGKRVARLPDWPRVPTTVWQREPSKPLSPAASHWLQQRSAVPRKANEEALNTRSSGLSNRDLHQVIFESGRSTDFYTQVSDLMHPTASVYIDPIFGEVKGQKAIREWLADIMPKTGNIEFELLQKPVFDDDMSYSEWRQVAVQPDGTRVVMTRGSSIRRYREGWIVYAVDYFDTAPFLDPAIQAASAAAGSTITLEDILRYRPDLRLKTDTNTVPVGDILGLTGTTGLAGTAAPTKPRVAEARQRLIQAAIAEIERTGNAAVSIREVARAAKVSHNTPYVHFPDKQALLMAVAAEGFWMLVESMEAAAEGASEAADRHRQYGIGFVRFGLSNPGLFRLIGNHEVIGATASAELQQARFAAAQLFGRAVTDLVRHHDGAFVDPKIAAVAGWALVQGLTSLLIEGQLSPGLLGARDGEAVAEQITTFFTSMLARPE